MGVDAHGLHLLRYAHRKHGSLGRTITLGRQATHLGPHATRRYLGPESAQDGYCEKLLVDHFGASSVDSIDNSPYENANILADMNLPIPERLAGAYDSVVDLGCLEHIFDVAQALRNVAAMCNIGGRIFHLLPSNGFCGHGFYQFSPELFFSYYSTESGFEGTELYFADLLDTSHWYRITPPARGERINVRSSHEIYVIVVTKRVADIKTTIQQSDYVHAWQGSHVQTPNLRYPSVIPRIREFALRHNVLARWIRMMDSALTSRVPHSLRSHPNLTRVRAG